MVPLDAPEEGIKVERAVKVIKFDEDRPFSKLLQLTSFCTASWINVLSVHLNGSLPPPHKISRTQIIHLPEQMVQSVSVVGSSPAGSWFDLRSYSSLDLVR